MPKILDNMSAFGDYLVYVCLAGVRVEGGFRVLEVRAKGWSHIALNSPLPRTTWNRK